MLTGCVDGDGVQPGSDSTTSSTERSHQRRDGCHLCPYAGQDAHLRDTGNALLNNYVTHRRQGGGKGKAKGRVLI